VQLASSLLWERLPEDDGDVSGPQAEGHSSLPEKPVCHHGTQLCAGVERIKTAITKFVSPTDLPTALFYEAVSTTEPLGHSVAYGRAITDRFLGYLHTYLCSHININMLT
jgi:hypothetical protein